MEGGWLKSCGHDRVGECVALLDILPLTRHSTTPPPTPQRASFKLIGSWICVAGGVWLREWKPVLCVDGGRLAW